MAAEQPLLLVTEIEPTETVDFPVGSSIRLHLAILDQEDRTSQDVDLLTLAVIPPYTATTVYTYGIGNTIVKSSLGVYYADIAINAVGQWRFHWLTTLNTILCGSSLTEIIAVDPLA